MISTALRKEWACAIGDFIIDFCQIEGLVTEIMMSVALEGQYEILGELSFKQRTELAKVALISRCKQYEQNINAIFSQIMAINFIRNAVAHSGFAIIADGENSKSATYKIGIGKRKCKKGSIFSIQEVRDGTVRLKKIESQLIKLMQQRNG